MSFAQSYEALSKELKASSDKAETHRLRAQLARAGTQRLENETLSASAKKKLRAEIVALCSDVQLGSMDLWFGDSVVTWARLLLLDDDWAEARSILLGQAEVLQNIEKNLVANRIPVSSISPVAGCRYFLGESYRIEYEETQQMEPAIEALKQFYNVYIKYGDSPWGSPAQEKAALARTFIERQGKRVRIDLGNHRGAFVANQFKFGARLVAQEKYADAVDPILTALNYYPESDKTISALRNLSTCWFQLDRRDEALMVAEYLCERFASDPNAPAAVLAIGRQFLDQDTAVADLIFEHYLATFPSDSHRTDILSHFAWKAYITENWTEAAARFQTLEAALRAEEKTGDPLEKAVYIQADCSKIIADYDRFLAEFPESEFAPRALGEKAQALLVAGEFDAAFQTLEVLTERYSEAPAARTALAGLIVAAVEAERFDIAGQVLDRMLADRQAYGSSVYISTGEALLAAEEFTLSENAFSAVAPATARSLHGLASAQFGQHKFRESFQTLDTLLIQFSTAGNFYAARLMQARTLVQLDRTEEALVAYGEVVAAKQDYAVAFEMAQFLTHPEEQLAAYQRIALLANPDQLINRPLIADSLVASLPLCMKMQKYQLALDSCDQFDELFPQHPQSMGTYRKEAEYALAQ